jgi:hypothetical protein
MPRLPKSQRADTVDRPTKQAVTPREPKPPSKLDTLAGLLRQEGDATGAELCAATGCRPTPSAGRCPAL